MAIVYPCEVEHPERLEMSICKAQLWIWPKIWMCTNYWVHWLTFNHVPLEPWQWPTKGILVGKILLWGIWGDVFNRPSNDQKNGTRSNWPRGWFLKIEAPKFLRCPNEEKRPPERFWRILVLVLRTTGVNKLKCCISINCYWLGNQ